MSEEKSEAKTQRLKRSQSQLIHNNCICTIAHAQTHSTAFCIPIHVQRDEHTHTRTHARNCERTQYITITMTTTSTTKTTTWPSRMQSTYTSTLRIYLVKYIWILSSIRCSMCFRFILTVVPSFVHTLDFRIYVAFSIVYAVDWIACASSCCVWKISLWSFPTLFQTFSFR